MAKSQYTINIYPLARRDIEDAVFYISKTLCNPKAADNLVDAIVFELALLVYNPAMYPKLNNNSIKDKEVRRFSVKNYLIFYHADAEKREIQVLRVIYGSRDYEYLF